MKRYEITRRGEPFVAGADEVVGADLTWQQALRFMASGDMNIDYALASLDCGPRLGFLRPKLLSGPDYQA